MEDKINCGDSRGQRSRGIQDVQSIRILADGVKIAILPECQASDSAQHGTILHYRADDIDAGRGCGERVQLQPEEQTGNVPGTPV